jgi:hypothetical protein
MVWNKYQIWKMIDIPDELYGFQKKYFVMAQVM